MHTRRDRSGAECQQMPARYWILCAWQSSRVVGLITCAPACRLSRHRAQPRFDSIYRPPAHLPDGLRARLPASMQSASTANAWRLIGPWTRTSAGMWSPREAFYLLDLINNQVDIIYDYDASILILKHVDLIVHHAPPPWSSSSLTAVWVHHQEVGSYYEQGPGLSKGLNTRLNIDESSAWTLSSTSTPMSRSGQGLFGGCDLGLRYLVALLHHGGG
ncbi:hypothetical protein V8E36_001846 [Tilletia maclaganii]